MKQKVGKDIEVVELTDRLLSDWGKVKEESGKWGGDNKNSFEIIKDGFRSLMANSGRNWECKHKFPFSVLYFKKIEGGIKSLIRCSHCGELHMIVLDAEKYLDIFNTARKKKQNIEISFSAKERERYFSK